MAKEKGFRLLGVANRAKVRSIGEADGRQASFRKLCYVGFCWCHLWADDCLKLSHSALPQTGEGRGVVFMKGNLCPTFRQTREHREIFFGGGGLCFSVVCSSQ